MHLYLLSRHYHRLVDDDPRDCLVATWCGHRAFVRHERVQFGHEVHDRQAVQRRVATAILDQVTLAGQLKQLRVHILAQLHEDSDRSQAVRTFGRVREVLIQIRVVGEKLYL